MRESCCQFGPGRALAGIITEPAAQGRRTGLVLVTAGLLPKSGPFRLYTDLARRLAHDGVLTLRFDLGGIGDSVRANAGRPLRERTAIEITAAVDLLVERHGLEAVVLGGLCSGAEDSLRHAETDRRITGVVMIDPFGYRTAGWKWRHLLNRATRRSLRALGLYQPHARPAISAASGAGGGKSIVAYTQMEHAESSRILRATIARGVHLHFVYTGGMRDTFNHERQLAAMFHGIDFRGLVTIDYFPRADHTQLLEEDREQVVEAIRRRLAPRER